MREDHVRAARPTAWIAGGMVAVALMLSSATGFAANGDLERVMGMLAQRRHGEVKYVERDYLGILERPVISAGVLIYAAPDHMEKRTVRPRAEALIVDGDVATVQRGRRSYRMELSAYPQVAPFVDAIRDTLAGDQGALERVFTVGFEGTVAEWRLRLVPLDKKVAGRVRRVEISGGRDEIRTVEILQADGDRSVMTLGSPPPAAP